MPPNQLAYDTASTPSHLPDLLRIVERQREYQRNGVARHQAGRRRSFHTRVPGVHEGAQKPEGQDGDDDAEYRQRGAELVPEARS